MNKEDCIGESLRLEFQRHYIWTQLQGVLDDFGLAHQLLSAPGLKGQLTSEDDAERSGWYRVIRGLAGEERWK